MSNRPRKTQAQINEELLSVDHLKDGLGKRTARGGGIVVAGQVVRILAQLATAFILARLLAPADFGLVAIGYTILAFITMFTELSLTTASVQSQRLTQDTASALLLINLGMTMIAVLAAVLSAPLTVWIFGDERLPAVVVSLALSAPISALGSQHNAILQRNMRWMSLQILSLGSMLAGVVGAVVAAWIFKAGYWSLVVQAIAGAIAGVILAWTMCPWRPSIVREWTGAKSALHFSVNLTGVMMMSFLHRQVDSFLVGWRWGTTELGYYSRAYSLLLMPLNLVTGPLSSAILPAMSRLQDDDGRWRTAYLDALTVVTIIGGGMAALLYGAAPVVIRIVFGPGWEESEKIFSFMAIAMLAATPMNTVVWLYVSKGRTKRMLHWSLMAGPFYALSFVVGLPYGAYGVAAAYSAAQFLAFIPCLWMATRQTNVTMSDVFNACLPAMLLTCLTGGALRLVVENVDFVLAIAASIAAAIIHLGMIALLVLRWPAYSRVRDRAVTTARSLTNRFWPKPRGA